MVLTFKGSSNEDNVASLKKKRINEIKDDKSIVESVTEQVSTFKGADTEAGLKRNGNEEATLVP